MHKKMFLFCLGMAIALPLMADENGAVPFEADPIKPVATLTEQSLALVARAQEGVETTLETALEFLGIRYRRGGTSPTAGFDCSGFVRYVFARSLGLSLPHNARAISEEGEVVADKSELKPGDLVFFNTMRRAFSHVGIYLGDGLFVHAPRAGGRVRVESLEDRYWSRRYNGARRLTLVFERPGASSSWR